MDSVAKRLTFDLRDPPLMSHDEGTGQGRLQSGVGWSQKLEFFLSFGYQVTLSTGGGFI